MLLLPNEGKQKVSFEAKVILMAFSVIISAMVFKNWTQEELLAKFEVDGSSTREVLQKMNQQYVEKENQLERIRAEKAKTEIRTIASVSVPHPEEKPQE